MQNPWQTTRISKIYENPWIELSHREVINPAGNPGIYGVVHFKNTAVGILPLDEHYNTWLVGQYRYTLEQYSWEIPEGGCPTGESPLAAAQRELAEETGIRAEKWTKILDMHTSNSVTDESGVAFIAQGLSFGESEPEDTEDLIVRKMPFEEALQMVLDDKITDSLSMITIMKVKIMLDRGELA